MGRSDYNKAMPTPFQHLTYAWAMLQDAALPELVRAHPGAFALGHTAGDVQSVSGQPRHETHFYVFPPTGHPRAVEVMLERYPKLRNSTRLEPEHAAFIAGYLAHLAWDEVWAWEVYIPCYLESGLWDSRLERAIHHNALRVRLDRMALGQLRAWENLVNLLARTTPRHWLPFVEDAMLVRWRDWLVQQLRAPDAVATARVFAERMGVPLTTLEAAIAAQDERRDTHITRCVEPALAHYDQRAFADGMHAVIRYLAPNTQPE